MCVCFLFSCAGFPIPKLDMLSQPDGGGEQWVPDPQDLEGRDILKVTYTGEDPETLSCGIVFTVSLTKKLRVLIFPKARLGCRRHARQTLKSGCVGLDQRSYL